MLGDDLVLFRDKTGAVVALSDWCPHRGARLSLGLCEFEGTVTCPYHGYVFDGTGQCVAGLIERPDSPFIGKLRARAVSDRGAHGDRLRVDGPDGSPCSLDEDLPAELSDPELTGRRFMRVKVWEANWVEPMAQGIDFHEFYLHRGLNVWRLFNYRLAVLPTQDRLHRRREDHERGGDLGERRMGRPALRPGLPPRPRRQVAAARVVAPARPAGPRTAVESRPCRATAACSTTSSCPARSG